MPSRRGVMTGAPALMCGLLAGCAGSIRAEYYRIAPEPGAVQDTVTADIMLRSIVLPGYLSRAGVPRPSGRQTLATFDNNVWAGTLTGLLQASMVQNLAQRMPAATVIGSGGAIELPGSTIVEINVLNFAPASDGRIALEADVSVKPPAGVLRATRYIRLQSSSQGIGPAQIVAGMSLVWGDFSDRVVRLIAATVPAG